MDQISFSYKDKEVLFNVPYDETDNISSQAILRHSNIFNRYIFVDGHLKNIPVKFGYNWPKVIGGVVI